MLNQIERLRLIADYTGEEIEPDKALWVLEPAAGFVSAMHSGQTDA
jgi:hypothetical protein